jgi:polyhydroxybutyrate depolymerase
LVHVVLLNGVNPAKLIPVVIATVFGLAHPALAQGGFSIFEHDGLQRQYFWHIPTDLSPHAPLVFVLHGYGGSAADMRDDYGWTELADEQGFALCFPQGTHDWWDNRFWNVGYEFHDDETVDDVGFLVALAGYLQSKHAFDRNRTFVSGYSNGGDMSYLLGCNASETFAAIAPVAGTMMESFYTQCTPETPRPVIAFHGTSDSTTWYDGDMGNTQGWGPYESVPNVIALWVQRNDTPLLEITMLPNTDPTDGSTVELNRSYSTEHHREVRLYRIIGGGHAWPGAWGNMDIDATRMIWEFFSLMTPDDSHPADLNQDGIVNGADLGLMLANWDGVGAGDLDNSGTVDGADLGLLLAAWSG